MKPNVSVVSKLTIICCYTLLSISLEINEVFYIIHQYHNGQSTNNVPAILLYSGDTRDKVKKPSWFGRLRMSVRFINLSLAKTAL